MRLSMLAASLMALPLASCVTPETGSRDRSYGFNVKHVKMDDDTYRVYDHPTDQSMKVTPSMGAILGMGAAQGVTMGMAGQMTPEQRLEAAARKHLDDTGRSACTITRGYLLHKPVYEFWFECPAE